MDAGDTAGNFVAGVFTHEFGHAINLSHSQVNGPMVYQSYTFQPYYPGVPGCVAPVHAWDHWDDVGVNRADPAIIETMYPFINSLAAVGQEQSTITHPDDIAGISNLYPTASYRATTGSITGVLRLKDGRTEFSGINVIARNVNDPLHDAVSAMTGDQTQGLVGPDGRFTINNLTPGQDYVVYIEEIVAGGYPTAAEHADLAGRVLGRGRGQQSGHGPPLQQDEDPRRGRRHEDGQHYVQWLPAGRAVHADRQRLPDRPCEERPQRGGRVGPDRVHVEPVAGLQRAAAGDRGEQLQHDAQRPVDHRQRGLRRQRHQPGRAALVQRCGRVDGRHQESRHLRRQQRMGRVEQLRLGGGRHRQQGRGHCLHRP